LFGYNLDMIKTTEGEDDQRETAQRRDALLLQLLKTPPQPRPKRERSKQKSTRTRASRASAKKP
jgi:hypothetical protein